MSLHIAMWNEYSVSISISFKICYFRTVHKTSFLNSEKADSQL